MSVASARATAWAVVCAVALALLAGCGGGAGNGNSNAVIPTPNALTISDVTTVIAQAVAEAKARNAPATIAVVDRVGNVLGIFAMTGAAATFTITSGTPAMGGLEGVNIVPSPNAAVAKAVTGAYLSSAGNAFSTRTANQIVQSHFNPQEFNQPGGPLSGVQFSQLICSDVIQSTAGTTIGPRPSPLGLSADPGGLPLYKDGTLVGGIGVISDGRYSVDLNIFDIDTDQDELIAVAGTFGFEAPADIRADRITVDGRTLRYVDSEATMSSPAAVPHAIPTGGALIDLPGYGGATLANGVEFGKAPSGYAPDPDAALTGKNAFTLVDKVGMPRFPPVGGSDAASLPPTVAVLSATEVTAILGSGLDIANRARAQIRRPLGSAAQVSVVVVDTTGKILGLTRTPDAPVFGTDVAVQKARTAAFFSSVNAASVLSGLPPAAMSSSIAAYVTAMRAFLNDPTALANGVAYSNRAVGNLARPFFPDGIDGTPNGPLAKPFPQQWSPFNDGLQLDLILNAVLASLGAPVPGLPPPADPTSCTGDPRLKNGIQIFPGSFPIYRGTTLVGAVGVSGDGIDQDDMVSFLGLANAGRALGTGIGNATPAIRADTVVPQGEGTRLRYVNCPQAPFNDSTEQNVCAGL
jgi:uncharacterized protein GlcG (DUF336 family)